MKHITNTSGFEPHAYEFFHMLIWHLFICETKKKQTIFNYTINVAR